MAKEKTEQILLDEEEINGTEAERVQVPIEPKVQKESKVTRVSEERDNLVNCLRNEKVIVRFIARAKGMITDPRHILFGGMAAGSKIKFTTPLLRSGQYADVLTKEEKKFLEYKLGLEPNALSVHNRTNNFWSDANEQGIGRIELSCTLPFLAYMIGISLTDFSMYIDNIISTNTITNMKINIHITLDVPEKLPYIL